MTDEEITAYVERFKKLWAEVEALPEPILTDKEQAYLGAVIKPFRKDVLNICRIPSFNHKSFISIEIDGQDEFFTLPDFETGTIFKNMQKKNVTSRRN